MSAEACLTTTVYYFIPSDGDKEDNPNAFRVKGTRSSLTVKQIKDSFPLPGSYYFRFKVRIGNTHAWMDPLSDEDVAPLYNDAIIAKVLRIYWDCKGRLPPRSGNKQETCSASGGVSSYSGSSNATLHQPQSQFQPMSQPPLLRHSMTASGAIPSSPPSSSPSGNHPNNVDLIDLGGDNLKWNSNSGYI